MRAIDADELKKCVLKWLPQDPCGKEEKEKPFETDICVSMLMEIDEQPTIQPELQYKTNYGFMWLCPKCGLPIHSDYTKCVRCGHNREKGV